MQFNKPRRKILIATFGSLGDLHPFLALAHALEREGFAPVIATCGAYGDYILGEGLSFAAVRPDTHDLTARLGIDAGQIAQKMAADDKFLFASLIFPHLRESFEDIHAAAEDAVAIVSHSLAFSARLVAEVRGLPLITVLLSPMMLASAFDPPLSLPVPLRRSPVWPIEIAYNRLMLWSFSQALGFFAEPLRRLRRELGLRPRYGLDLLLSSESSDAMIGLFSPLLAPAWHSDETRTLIAGHTFHDRDLGGAGLQAELEDFLVAGGAPIVITLGTFVTSGRRDFYRESMNAASRLGLRAVVLAHDDDTSALAADCPREVFVASYAPHSLIFPRAAAIIHHGGIGTAGQALRSGRPQLVAPFLGDQFDNAQRLARLGLAAVLRGASTATADALSRALSALDAAHDRRAGEVAELVKKEDGAAAAARRIAIVVGPDKTVHESASREQIASPGSL